MDEGDDDEVMAAVETAGNAPAVEAMDIGDIHITIRLVSISVHLLFLQVFAACVVFS